MNFSTRSLQFADTNQFSRLFIDYVNQVPAVAALQAFAPSADGYRAAAATMQYAEANRVALVTAIRKQYLQDGATLPEALLQQLSQTGTLTVCTGHQLALLGGPLFFVYKILTAIKVAASSTELLGTPVVPVFWMASEDHDLDEIRSIQLYGKTLTWTEPTAGAVGHLRTDSLQPLLDELTQLLGTAPGAVELMEELRNSYAPGQSLAAATRRFVHLLFGNRILVLDADDAVLKQQFLPHLRAELESNAVQQQVEASIAQLEEAGYSAQVNPRPINLFYLTANTRERIDRNNEGFMLTGGRQFAHAELLAELEAHPEKFSPNVVLRPLYQQVILPNIAYVGGPGELAYWLQYRAMFDAQGVLFPVLQPRAFALVLDKGVAGKLEKLNVQLAELFADTDTLQRNYVQRLAGAQTAFSDELADIEHVFARITAKAAAIDPTLRGAAESTLQQQRNSLATLEAKVLRALKQKEETALEQLRKIREKILPGGSLQERVENILPLWLRYGNNLLDTLETEIEIGRNELLVLTED